MANLIISAGGKNTRIKEYISTNFEGIPKHILPLPAYNMTVLEKIVADAHTFFDRIIIAVNSDNILYIEPIFRNNKKVVVVIDEICNGPLGPMFRTYLETKEDTYGCAGDFFCNFSWREFKKHHDAIGKEVSILVSRTIPTKDGARFSLNEQGIITSWERVADTTEDDLINIGCYVMKYTDAMSDQIRDITYCKEDILFDTFIPRQVISGYNPGCLGFNINTPQNYEALCNLFS